MKKPEQPAPYPAVGEPKRVCGECSGNKPLDAFPWVDPRTERTKMALGRRAVCGECIAAKPPGQGFRRNPHVIGKKMNQKDWEMPS